jgi:dipeptidyl-peptidase III
VLTEAECSKTHGDVVQKIWHSINKEVYNEEDPFRILGFRDNNGTTSYYSSNVTSDDAKKVDEFCQANKISPLNTRLMKLGNNELELRIASAIESQDKTPYLKTYTHTLASQETIKVHVKAGDFTEIMQKVVEALGQSLHYAANDNQRNMIRDYIEHFKYGE